LCNQGATKSDFMNHWKNYSFTKQLLDNKLAVGAKRQLRRMVIDRVVLQQKMRMSEASTSVVTATHREIFLALLQLATSQYSEVSPPAQYSWRIAYLHFFIFLGAEQSSRISFNVVRHVQLLVPASDAKNH
jgi:hypothetical protein